MEKFENITDQDLIKKLTYNQHTVLKEVYKRGKYEMIRNWVFKNGGREEDAKDVFQEAVLVLYQKAFTSEFQLTAAISTYIFAVARNKWLKQINKDKMLVNKDISEYEEFIDVDDDESGDLEVFEEKISFVEATIKEMGDPCKSILTRFYYYKQSLSTIKEAMGYKEINVVKQAKFKCIQRIKKKIA